ncbi:scavenger receptor cysteine-rich type 1 protein M160-like isoform X2 [Liolophura sinensis]|uniref:scavenger receptor cysteine-rich type 1 protein M160-like isoform X2 n=1 Tax=Liolophura sinensis TaxID=3198878 RepID=UPI0031581D41
MGVGNVTLTFIKCQGNESRLIDCFHMILGFPFEVCKESAGVECRRNDDYTPRISDGRNFTSPNGRLDLKIAGQWNAQCGKISNKTAIVACRQMGLPSSFARMLPANVKYPAQTIPNITLEVRCTGQENNLLECQIPQKSGPCDATFGIVCSDDPGYQVRLVGGENHTGRLEVKIAGIWGTVCDNSFYDRGAKVICRQLGFDNAVPLVWPTKDIGQADPKQPIWLTSAYCSGDEGSFKDCSYKFEHNDMCSHEADVIVSCKSLEELDVPIRLAGGADNTTGRLELFYDGQWGTVCRYYFSAKSAEVACRQLGLPYTDATLINSFGDPATSPIWLNYLKCKGGESHIIQCRHYPINTSDCDPRRDAFLQCQDYTDLFKKYKPASTTVASKKNPTSGGAKTIRFDPFMIFTLVVLSSTYIFRVNTVRLVSGILSVVGAILLAIGGCCVKKKFNKWASSPGRDESSAVAAQYTPSTGHSPAETPDQTVSLIFQKTDAPPSYSDLYGKDRASKSTPPLS